ncbi:hypothetical protein [Globicatella sanguinis]
MNSDDFKQFVDSITNQLNIMRKEKNDSRFSRKTTPTEFEKLVVDASYLVIKNQNINCAIDYTEGGHAFPDIVYHFDDNISYGIEVKSSTQSKASETSWTILGNSILGSTRIDVDDLFIIYIKVGDNGCFIKSARYEDSVSDVAVTHSPRFKLDLNQSASASFFARSGISYNELKDSINPIGIVTDYFKKEGLTAWWIAESTPAIIRNWNELNNEEKNELLAKGLALFPEIIYSKSSDKYKNLSKWLVANFSVVDSSLRDKFTAGGRSNLSSGDNQYLNFPKIYETFQQLSEYFLEEIKNVSVQDIEEYWISYNLEDDTFANRLNYWKRTVFNGLKNEERFSEYKNFLNSVLSEITWP